MNTIDVRGLPKSVARALESLAESLRRQLRPEGSRDTRPRVELTTRPGKAFGSFTRREIYEDAG